MYCKSCGKEIDDSAYVCIHCGSLTENNVQTQKTSSNGIAIAGFVCSFFIPLLGWIFGGIGLSRANKLPTRKGKSLSVAAIIIASIMFIINFITLLN